MSAPEPRVFQRRKPNEGYVQPEQPEPVQPPLPQIDPPSIDRRYLVRNWVVLDSTAKDFSTKAEEVKTVIKRELEAEGETDDKGSYWFRFEDDPVEGKLNAVKWEKRVSRRLDPNKAEDFLKAAGLYDDCTETVVIINEDKLLGAHFSGRISDADLESLYTVTESFAFVPKWVK